MADKKEKAPKKQAPAVETQEQSSPTKRKERKIIILDHFNKKILNVILAALILSIAVPIIVFSFVAPTKLLDVAVGKGAAYYAENIKAKVQTLTYSYTDAGTTYTKDYSFSNGVLTKKVFTTSTETTSTVVVVRKLGVQDKDFIKANISGMAEATDKAISDYVATSTEYIEITNMLVNDKYEVVSQTITSKTYLELDGTTYQTIFAGLGFSETIVSAQAKADYKMFGLGYGYKDYVLTDDQGNIVAFEKGFLDKLTVASNGRVYDFSVNAPSYAGLNINNI